MQDKALSIIGVGAFGEFMASHLYNHFNVILHDPYRDLSSLSDKAVIGSLSDAAAADYIILAVPVKFIEPVIRDLSPMLVGGRVIMDVASVKCKPRDIITSILPSGVRYMGLHPLFGPESGKNGIAGLNVTVCGQGDELEQTIVEFLSNELQLNVFQTSAEEHDKQMAYVQGLSHMIGKAFHNMNLPEINQSTHSFSLLSQMAGNVKNDSDDLFVSIQRDNPYSEKVREQFFESIRDIEKMFKN